MTATLERPLRARAGLRAMIYGMTMRASQTPAYHPLRLQLQEELADLRAQLTEVELYIGAFRPSKPSKLAAATEVVPIRDRPRATRPGWVAQGDEGYARGEETCLEWTANEKHEPGDHNQAPSTVSVKERYRFVTIRSLHRAGALAAHAAAESSRSAQRMLETVGESVIEFWDIVLRESGRFADHARGTFSHCGNVATRNCRHAVILTRQGVAASSRLLWQSVERLVATGKESRAFASRTLSRSSDRLGVLLGNCLVAAAIQRRLAGARIRQWITASASFLHQSTQMVVATSMELWRSARQTLIRTSDRISAVLGQCRVATDQGVRRAYAAAMQGFAATRLLLLRKIDQPVSRWAESLRRVVLFRVADGVSTATGTGRRVADRAGAEAKRRIIACGLFLQMVMAAAPDKGKEISTFCRRLSLRISDRARKAPAVYRPAAMQALRNAQSATLRSAARCQQITLETLKTARAKWAELSRQAALAGAEMGRRAAPRLQQAGVQAKRGIAAGRLFLQKVMIAADIKSGEMSTFWPRLSLRISDCIKKSARHLPSLRDGGPAAPDADPAFGVGTRIVVDGGNASWSGDTIVGASPRVAVRESP